jgi:hypothetical protein
MTEQNSENKNLEVLGNNQVSSANIPQPTKNLALPELGNNAMTTEADAKSQEDQRIINKFAKEELQYDDLNKPLSTTVFEDENVKMPLFLVSLLTFTAEEQRNLVLTGESSVGKTLNIRECLWYFRHENSDTIFEINDATPRALIFSPNSIPVDDRTIIPIDLSKEPQKGDAKEVWDIWYEQKRHTAYFLNLSNKIVVLYDLKNYDLLQNLRSLLSHDNKICSYLITDKSPNGGHKTKKVLIQGYFTAIFASAHGEMDEQEVSRNYLLSPSDNPDKIRKAIDLQARKMTDPKFNEWYENEPSRVGLKKRVQSIKEANIKKVLFKAEDMENLKEWFFKNIDNLAPKSQRDFPRLYALAEAWALLNFMHRERTPDNSCIYTKPTDIEGAKKVYEPILKCNGLGLTPEEYAVWKIIEKAFDENSLYIGTGLRIQEIHNVYFHEKQRRCSDKRLRGMLKNFCSAGLLKEEKEGVIIKYYPITHKETKQSEFSNKGDGVNKSTNPFFNNDNQPTTL